MKLICVTDEIHSHWTNSTTAYLSDKQLYQYTHIVPWMSIPNLLWHFVDLFFKCGCSLPHKRLKTFRHNGVWYNCVKWWYRFKKYYANFHYEWRVIVGSGKGLLTIVQQLIIWGGIFWCCHISSLGKQWTKRQSIIIPICQNIPQVTAYKLFR